MGQVLTSLREYLDLEERVAQSFELALNHGFFERHNFAIYSEAGRDGMIDQLETTHQQLVEAYEIAQPAAGQRVARLQAARSSRDTRS